MHRTHSPYGKRLVEFHRAHRIGEHRSAQQQRYAPAPALFLAPPTPRRHFGLTLFACLITASVVGTLFALAVLEVARVAVANTPTEQVSR